MLGTYSCKIFVLFFLHVCLGAWAGASRRCSLQGPPGDPGKLSLLHKIQLLTGQKYMAKAGDYTYAVTICSDVSKENHSNASVTKTKISTNSTTASTVIGRHNDTDIVGGENWLMLMYSGGDVNTEGDCNGTKWKTNILMTCSSKSDDLNLELVADLTVGCFAMFHLKTSILCPVEEGLGKGMVILFLLLTSAICYLLVGVAYRRLVAGAKGLEQIPNYQFWSNLASTPYNYFRRKEEAREEDSAWRPQEQADEPLLSP